MGSNPTRATINLIVLLLSVSFKDLSIGNHITDADEKASGVNMAGKNFTTFLIYLNV